MAFHFKKASRALYIVLQEKLSVGSRQLHLFGTVFLGLKKSRCKETSNLQNRKIIFGFSARNVRSFKELSIYILHVTSWSSAAYIYNLHLQRHVLAPPGQAFSRVVCDEPAGPVSSGTPRLFTSFLKYFTSYLGLRFIYIYCPKLLLAWFGLALDRCSIAPRMKTKP